MDGAVEWKVTLLFASSATVKQERRRWRTGASDIIIEDLSLRTGWICPKFGRPGIYETVKTAETGEVGYSQVNGIHACEAGNNEIGRDVQGHANRRVKRNV
jgi:hypothetical protein